MRTAQIVPLTLILLVALAPLGVAAATQVVENVRLVASAPTHLQVDWQGQAEAYLVAYSSHFSSKSSYSPIVARGPMTLVDLVPETEYILKVQALEPEPEGAEEKTFKVIGESKPLAVTTEPWQPREWEDLLLWPSRHVDTVDAAIHLDSPTFPAVTVHNGELLVVQHQGSICVSRVDPTSGKVLTTEVAVWPAPSITWGRTNVDAVAIQDTLWLTYLEYWSRAGPPIQLLQSWDLPSESRGQGAKLEQATSCGLVNFNGQLWVLWTEPGANVLRIARYDPLTGLQTPQSWEGTAETTRMGVAALDLDVEILVTFLAEAHRFRFSTLQAIKFNGQEFYEHRMLRGRGEYSSPTGAAVNDTIVLAYAKATGERLSDIDITLTSAEAGEVTSTSYIRDGTYNITPDAVAVGDTIYIVYNKWSAPPDSPNAVNYGTFIGKIELKF